MPDLDSIPDEKLEAARLLFINYPNNPTGAIVPDGFFERVVELAQRNEILVVHDNAYSETTYDGYVAPSFLATPGAKEVGVEVFSLSKGYNMTGWRCAAILGNAEAIKTYWRLKTNVDSGLFEAVQLAGAAALRGPRKEVEQMCRIYERRRDLVVEALRDIGVEVEAPKGTIYIWAPVPDGHTSSLLRRAGARGGGRRRLARLDVRPERRGVLPDLPDHARRAPERGRPAPQVAPDSLASAQPAPRVATRTWGRAGLSARGRIGLYRRLS